MIKSKKEKLEGKIRRRILFLGLGCLVLCFIFVIMSSCSGHLKQLSLILMIIFETIGLILTLFVYPEFELSNIPNWICKKYGNIYRNDVQDVEIDVEMVIVHREPYIFSRNIDFEKLCEDLSKTTYCSVDILQHFTDVNTSKTWELESFQCKTLMIPSKWILNACKNIADKQKESNIKEQGYLTVKLPMEIFSVENKILRPILEFARFGTTDGLSHEILAKYSSQFLDWIRYDIPEIIYQRLDFQHWICQTVFATGAYYSWFNFPTISTHKELTSEFTYSVSIPQNIELLINQIDKNIQNGYVFQNITVDTWENIYKKEILDIYKKNTVTDVIEQETLDILTCILDNMQDKKSETEKEQNMATITALKSKLIMDGLMLKRSNFNEDNRN